MKLIHIICQYPDKLKGEYYFDYFGDFIWFLFEIKNLKAALRKYYQHELKKEGIVSAATDDCAFTATMDLKQFKERYK